MIKDNIEELQRYINIAPAKLYENKIKERLDISLKDYYNGLSNHYDKISDKIERDTLKTTIKLLKEN